jgi:peptide/nickel transport system permease protein
MNRYVLQRLALVIPTVTGVSLIIFALMRLLPGDVVDILFGGDTQADQRTLDQIRENLGLNRPLAMQYLEWIGGFLRGNFGVSMRTGIPVAESIAQGMPVTLQLAVMAIFFCVPVCHSIGDHCSRASQWGH